MNNILDESFWSMVKEEHIKNYGYSGTVIKALRIKFCTNVRELAAKLRRRRCYVKRLENCDKIGIKQAKDIAAIFRLEDWRILRDKDWWEEHKKDIIVPKETENSSNNKITTKIRRKKPKG